MSKIGKKPIVIPENVNFKIDGAVLEVSSKDGKRSLKLDLLPNIEVKNEGNEVVFSTKNDDAQTRANWGTIRALVQNAVNGMKEDFKKVLEFQGVGFRANVEGKNLVLNIGFSHPVKFEIPNGIIITVEKSNIIIAGIDKYLVGQVAAKIRALKKPNPYRGTGIKYKEEIVRRKAGKKASSGTGAAA
ncbi:MAG: 50S ribosomal protein L6 [Patescibacteria group bacterium]|nr:50S ribosomal protein L6 [Patescibacteria group bacterium]